VHAGAELELEYALGAVLVADQLIAARVLDPEGTPPGHHRADA
jgi:hypothetical protein